MQTTLLGLAIAVILALVAALAGPLLIDWGSHRTLFEAEASRLIGVRVRVTGAIDARLLPSPQLTLHDIEIGDRGDMIRARALAVEFALGPLIRGEWRAAEMRLVGPQVNLGLDASGHVRAPNLAVTFKADELSVDRLSIEDGTVTLTDAASGAHITLGKVKFKGEARSLVGPVKGAGEVTFDGKLYPYRVAAGRLGEDGALKLHVNVDPVDHPVSIEADGTLTFAARDPRFDGTLNLSRPVGIGSRGAAQPTQTLTQPWRIGGKIKATAQSALIENVEFQYGSEEQGVRLNGVADFKFGARPRFNGVLSGRQIDLDRAAFGTDGSRQPPASTIRKLVESGTTAFRPPIPFQIGIGIDQLTLGGNSVQNLRGDITSNDGGWNLDRLEFRAPGLTQVRMSGRLTANADGATFNGPTEIEASDPNTLAAWLEGRNETVQSDLRPLSLRGDITLANDKVAIEGLKAELDRKPVTGRLSFAFASSSQPAKFDAELNAPQFDADAAFEFGRALLAGSALERPSEIGLAADFGRVTFRGIEARDASARLKFDDSGLQLDRLSVGDLGGGSFAASGRIETGGHAPRGVLSLDLEAKKTATIATIIKNLAPKGAGSVAGLLDRVGHARLHATLDIAGEDKAAASVAQVALTGDVDDMRIDARVRVHGDWTKPSTGDVHIDANLDAPDGGSLIKFMSLDRAVAVGKGPGHLKLQVAGSLGGDVTLDILMSASGLSAKANGSGRLSEIQDAKIAANLQVMQADVRPLRPVGTGSAEPLPLKLTSRVNIAGGTMTLDNIEAKLAGASIRGRVAFDHALPIRIDGIIEDESADVAALIAYAVGMPPQPAGAGTAWTWPSEPFNTGVLGKIAGSFALKLARAELLPRLTARGFNATLRLTKDEIALEDATGDLAGGRIAGRIVFRSSADGLTAQAKVSLTDAKAAELLRAETRPPISGSFGLTTEVEGTGLSPIALIGSLKGSGKIVLTDGQIAGLDPQTFKSVTHAVDQGLAIETGRISELARKSLEGARLSLSRADSIFDVSAGQLRLRNVAVDVKDAVLSIAGMLDLTDGSIDARLVLSGASEAAGPRPNIFVTLKGPFTAPSRNVDASALAEWLTLRSVDNQAKRLRAIENAPSQPRGEAVPENRQAPPLPAPIDIKSAPAPRNAKQPAASIGSQN